jgi:hypothetical protein
MYQRCLKRALATSRAQRVSGWAMSFVIVLAAFTRTSAQPPAPAASCLACNLKLLHRTGLYLISIEARLSSSNRATVTGTIVSRPGEASGPHVETFGVLNILAPGYKSIEKISSLRPHLTFLQGKAMTFSATASDRFGKPGLYRLNVSYGNVDSNTVEVTVR